MIAFLESLGRLPGVEFVLLTSHDGVPIAHVGERAGSEREESLAALATAWLNDVAQAIAPLSWQSPVRIALRAGRGTLVLRRSDSACLLVLLGRESSPEDVRLAMDGTLARIERARHGRSTGNKDAAPQAEAPAPGPIPSRPDACSVEEGVRPASHPGKPPGN